jgi:transcriptional regulator with XRE-family HTH domain
MDTKQTPDEWLKEQMRRRDWTAARLAREAGVYPSVITRILLGERAAGATSASRIAKAFGISEIATYQGLGLFTEPLEPRTVLEAEGMAALQSMTEYQLKQTLVMLRALKLAAEQADQEGTGPRRKATKQAK